jgi:preprotein translocase subunit SecG
VATYLDIALIITSIALIASVVLQNKGVGLGGLTGADSGSVFTARRGIEKVLFYVTIGLSLAFFLLTILAVIFGQTA